MGAILRQESGRILQQIQSCGRTIAYGIGHGELLTWYCLFARFASLYKNMRRPLMRIYFRGLLVSARSLHIYIYIYIRFSLNKISIFFLCAPMP